MFARRREDSRRNVELYSPINATFEQICGCYVDLGGASGSLQEDIRVTPSSIHQQNDEKGEAMPFQLMIEVEEADETLLCLRIDTQVIAKNLTTAQMKFLVGEILDRIAAADVEKAPESFEGQLH
jgi:hypothetical protein